MIMCEPNFCSPKDSQTQFLTYALSNSLIYNTQSVSTGWTTQPLMHYIGSVRPIQLIDKPTLPSGVSIYRFFSSLARERLEYIVIISPPKEESRSWGGGSWWLTSRETLSNNCQLTSKALSGLIDGIPNFFIQFFHSNEWAGFHCFLSNPSWIKTMYKIPNLCQRFKVIIF